MNQCTSVLGLVWTGLRGGGGGGGGGGAKDKKKKNLKKKKMWLQIWHSIDFDYFALRS